MWQLVMAGSSAGAMSTAALQFWAFRFSFHGLHLVERNSDRGAMESHCKPWRCKGFARWLEFRDAEYLSKTLEHGGFWKVIRALGVGRLEIAQRGLWFRFGHARL